MVRGRWVGVMIGITGIVAGGAAFGQASPHPRPLSQHRSFLAWERGDKDSFFPFVIPWDDSRSGTATDVSFLNRRVEPVVAKDGHFYGKNSGKRIRFVGVNFAAGANFPSHADAEKVAARLAKYGVNLVRMHHMDNLWDRRGSIWDFSYPDHRHISKEQRDRMDYLVAQFEKHGIYVDVNLHVSRQFSAADGFPASVEQIPFSFDKRVDQFDARMIDLQKEYARDLLTHVNPYTHRAYVSDPGVAMVEINNENSLEGDPWATIGGGLDQLPAPFSTELQGLWNKWLGKTYPSDAALKAAWTHGITPPGPSIVGLDSNWDLEQQGGAAKLTTTPSDKEGVAPGVMADVTAVDGTSWHIQAKISGLTLHNGDTYTLGFRARADKPRSVGVNLQLAKPNWSILGLASTASLTSDWKDFQYTFTAKNAEPNMAKLDFVLGDATGKVWISDVTLSPGMPNAGLAAGETLDAGNIAIPATGGSGAGQWHDWVTFLGDTEKAYADGMRVFLKKDLGVRANVIESQLGFGGMTSVRREMDMDYADSHAYWQHPSFPHKAWDMSDWNIPNTSMVSDLARGGGGTLRDLAEYRIAGKPYTVSEYNHPAPNDFQSETVPIIFSFAAAQDWDGIMLFDYGDYGTGVDNDKIGGFFGIGPNPAKVAFLPAAAMLFRAGLLAPLSASEARTIPVVEGERDSFHQTSDVWKEPADYLTARISLLPSAYSVTPTLFTNKREADASTSLFIHDERKYPVYVADGPSAQAFAGFVGGHAINVGPATYDFDKFGNDFASVMLTPMDTLPIAKSKHLLLTVVGKVENQDMGWNSDRTSVENNWGHAPVQAEDVPGTVSITVDGPRVVRALSPTGTEKAILPSKYRNGKLTFRIGGSQTLWYSIEAQKP